MLNKDYKLYGTKILNLQTQEIGLLVCLWKNKFVDGEVDCLGLFGSFSLSFRFRKFINFLSLHQTFTLTSFATSLLTLPKIRFATCVDKQGKYKFNERTSKMNKEENRNNNEVQVSAKRNKGEKIMNSVKTERRVGTAHQQNLIELFTYIYNNPGRHTYYSLANEMSKGTRAIQRMIDDINTLYPCISTIINDTDGKAYLKAQEKLSEKLLDNSFQKSEFAPILYIFLKSFIIRPISIGDVMHDLNLNKKEATKIIEKIFDATCYGEFMDYDVE